ncbi:MAG: PTS sugar transporter subunit IIA [Treponema sp.]
MNEDSYMNSNPSDLKNVLSPDVVNLHLKGKTKVEIIEELLDILVKTEKIKDKKVALACVMDREKKLSTGIKHGIALPHGKTNCVSELVACIGISDDPIEFNSLDKKPARIFIMTLSPINKTGPHLQFLSQVISLLKSEVMREKCLKAKTSEELIEILVSEDE